MCDFCLDTLRRIIVFLNSRYALTSIVYPNRKTCRDDEVEDRMATIKTENPRPPLKYRRVESSTLSKGRRGKHYDLIQGILLELETASAGSALKIPLDDVGGIGLANLRSAVHRAAKTESLSIETLADNENFYVWKTA
jgi:hypothetical protein